ncbi:MAG: division/cell wall cluster transcriptional repressor MraZ [bacterium]|nr:division/cell wall cluster transcriptional repressor MraZ [bacterium]
MTFFVGEFDRQLDDNGRFILPSKLRKDVGEAVYITRSPSDKCLHLYTVEGWEEILEKLRQLPTATDRNAAAFVRMFCGRASLVKVDKQGRIAVTQKLIDYAEMKRDVVLVGANTRMELWDSEKWENYQNELSDDIVLDGIEKYGLII